MTTAAEDRPPRFWYDDFRVHRSSDDQGVWQIDDARTKEALAVIRVLSQGSFCLRQDGQHLSDHQSLKDALLALRSHLAGQSNHGEGRRRER